MKLALIFFKASEEYIQGSTLNTTQTGEKKETNFIFSHRHQQKTSSVIQRRRYITAEGVPSTATLNRKEKIH